MLFYILIAWFCIGVISYQLLILRLMAKRQQKVLTYKDILISIPFGPCVWFAIGITYGLQQLAKKIGA